MFMGFIRGVSDTGKLVLELEDRVFKEFGLKEVSLLY
jgi:BirA family biotin operon repressor/biotin-[acetyl-CoA-carboxylase] ligase